MTKAGVGFIGAGVVVLLVGLVGCAISNATDPRVADPSSLDRLKDLRSLRSLRPRFARRSLRSRP